jgi:predicted metalloprotease with PDZ domain
MTAPFDRLGPLRLAVAKVLFCILAWATAFALATCGQCSFSASSTGKPLKYVFEPVVTDGKLIMHVTMEFQGGRTGTAELELPSDWAEQSHLEAEVTSLTALSADIVVHDTARPNIKNVRFSPNRAVIVSYDLVKDWNGPLEYPKQFRAVLEPEYFEFTTQNALVHPKFSPTDIVSVHFDWQKLPVGWNLETSFGADDRCQSFSGLWYKVNDALFAGGDFRIHRVSLKSQLLVVAIRGKWSFSDEEAVERIGKIVTAEREFWQDNDFPYYLVTLKPFDMQSGSSDGSGFTNAFWLYLPRRETFSYGLQYLLAHESFHAWNPHKMGHIPEPGETVHWFTEGFTVYYSDLLLVRAGLLSVPEYIDKLNRRIGDYEFSPVKNLSNKEMVARYHKDNSVNQLPYVRGPVIALWLDAQIRRQSRNKFSLDTVMHKLVRDASKDLRQQLTTERVLRTAGKYLNGHAREMFSSLVESGETIPVPDFPLSECLHLSIDEVPSFDLGFDGAILRAKSRVSGVNPESEAFKAGVREGQEVLGMSIYWDDASKPVRLKVRTGDGQQAIEYFPRGKSIPAPQYHLDKDTWASAPERCTFPPN